MNAYYNVYYNYYLWLRHLLRCFGRWSFRWKLDLILIRILYRYLCFSIYCCVGFRRRLWNLLCHFGCWICRFGGFLTCQPLPGRYLFPDYRRGRYRWLQSDENSYPPKLHCTKYWKWPNSSKSRHCYSKQPKYLP